MSHGLNETNHGRLTRVFEAFPAVRSVLIFGSRARGDAREGSDFDLAVVAPDMTAADFARLWDAVESLELIFKIDLIHFDRLPEGPLKGRIRAEGRPFFSGLKRSA